VFRPITLYIGLRYTRAKRRNHFISFISLASMLSIAIGVAVLITVLSVMNGFDEQIHQRIFSMASQVSVSKVGDNLVGWNSLADKLKAQPYITGIAPVVNGEGILTYNSQVQPSLISGILPQQESQVSKLADKIIQGNIAALKPGAFNIIIGQELALNLGVQIGDKVTLLLPQASVTPVGVMPRFKRFTVSAIFNVGNGFGFDSGLAFIHIQDAQKLLQIGSTISALRLKLNDAYQAPQVAQKLMQELGPEYMVNNWTEQYGALFQAISMEKAMMFFILLLIIGVAAFNLVSTLVMVVTEKQADIAILRTLGATPQMIKTIFMVQGTVVGLIGTLLGLIGGILLATHATQLLALIERLLHVQLLSSSVYYVNYLPSKLQVKDVIQVSLAAFLMTLLATLYPAGRAARIQPAEALRYE
jgi:lipoprotein-releasing system permease protein